MFFVVVVVCLVLLPLLFIYIIRYGFVGPINQRIFLVQFSLRTDSISVALKASCPSSNGLLATTSSPLSGDLTNSTITKHSNHNNDMDEISRSVCHSTESSYIRGTISHPAAYVGSMTNNSHDSDYQFKGEKEIIYRYSFHHRFFVS